MVRYSSSRRRIASWPLVLAFLLVISSCASVRQAATTTASRPTPPTSDAAPALIRGFVSRPIIDTWENIHIFETFDYNITNPAAVARYYDFVWGADVNHVAAIRAGNPDILISYYISFFRDQGTFFDNDALHDLASWKATHPDWVLYKCDRTTPAYEFGNPNMPLAFFNPAVVAWQLKTYGEPASENGYDAIAADNLVMVNLSGACGSYINGKWVQRYSGGRDDQQWRKDVIAWTTAMQQGLHRLPHPLALIANFDPGTLPVTDPEVRQILDHLDGISDESGFTQFGQTYMTDNNWLRKIQYMLYVQQEHKPYYLVEEFPSIGQDEIQWALASYLMGKEHSAALFISSLQAYGGDTRYPEYNAQIGSPLGPMYQSQGVYFRKYSNGLVIVNSTAADTITVNLDPGMSYVDLYGNAVQQAVTMPPHSGLVLLNRS